VADHLIGHFVDQARRAGASWTDIGRSMGVSKQAAQKRFVPKDSAETPGLDPAQGFGAFTARARNVIVTAHNEARAHGGTEVLPEHLVLALLTDPDSFAGRALAAQVPDLHIIRTAVAAALPAPVDEVPDLVPYDARARKALELTYRQALRRGHNYVGTEHILLGLLEFEAGTGVLNSAGIDADAAEAHITKALTAFAAASTFAASTAPEGPPRS
jgi:ATP-dependent Clp protease ATP-binding subunit ClpA